MDGFTACPILSCLTPSRTGTDLVSTWATTASVLTVGSPLIKYHYPVTQSKDQIELAAAVPDQYAGHRLDQAVAKMFPDYSRARLQAWIRSGELLVNGEQKRPKDPVEPGAAISISAELLPAENWTAETLPLDIVFEDEHLLVINKATNTVVHPAAGHRDGTLLNGLLGHCPSLENLPRAGIVHRLDKDTTGLMVVAKTLPAHTSLVKQLHYRAVKREYAAVVQGVLTGGGTVDAPLDRHPVNRKKRAVVKSGQEAVTHYRVEKRFRSHTYVHVQLETGRTHQIRVHMAHIGHALVGDPTYGGRKQIPADCSGPLAEQLQNFNRQALHARRLTLVSPSTQQSLCWEAPLPEDMQHLLQALEQDSTAGDENE
jgi:23S rRNA pseudouridine1911/1915/1917 synthase